MGSYNGWRNYETWVVKLWMDNEEGSHSHFRELAETMSKEEFPNLSLAEAIKDEFTEFCPQLTGVYSDLMNAAFSSVDWHEIAENLLDDYTPEPDDETCPE